MKNKIYIILSILIISSMLFLNCEKEQATFPNQNFKGLATQQGTVTKITIPGPYVGAATRNVNVYTPYGYDATADKTYPVIYFLHGFGGNEDSWLSFKLPEVADLLIAEGTIEPIILVMPSAVNPLGGGFYTNSIDTDPTRNPNLDPSLGFGAYEYFIVGNPQVGLGTDPNSVIGAVESQYKIDPNKRAIEGHSMGGYGAMRLALLYPSLFKSVAAHSGPLSLQRTLSDGYLLPRVALENPGKAKIDLAAAAADQQGHVVTLFMFGIASSFSPHFGNPVGAPPTFEGGFDTEKYSLGLDADSTDNYQYIVDPTPVVTGSDMTFFSDFIFAGVDLPITLDGQGNVDTVTAVWQKWMAQDIYTLVATGPNALNPTVDVTGFSNLAIYFDCGTGDDYDPMDDGLGIGLINHNDDFDALLTTKGISHTYKRYTGSHSSDVYYRIEIALKFHDAVF